MKFKLYLFISIMALSVMSSCRKESFEGDPTGENGKTFIRFRNTTDKAPINELYFTPFTDVKTVELLNLRRDAGSSASLNSTLKISIAFDPTAITAYSTAAGSTYDVLPESIYTVDAPGFTKTASGYDVTFNPGEYSKSLMIKLDGSKYDLSKKYAVAYKITSISGDGTLTSVPEEKTIVTSIAIKNKYDGVYLLTGFHNRSPYNFPYETEVELRTISASEVRVYWPDAGDYGHPIGVGPDNDLNWYGNTMSPAFQFDLATNDVTSAYNLGGATVISLYTSADGSDALANKYDAATKTIEVSWKYSNNAARAFFDKLVYVRERD